MPVTQDTQEWNPESARFCTTQWTLVLGAGGAELERARALEHFCHAYWYPVYAFIRRRGQPHDEARDLTQDFFAALIEKDWLSGVERRDTRFSTLLLNILQNFLTSAHRRSTAEKRGGGIAPLSIDHAQAEEWFGAEPATGETPEKTFARRWALAVMQAAHEVLSARAEAAGKARQFDLLAPFLAREPQPGEYEALAPALGQNAGALAVSVHRLRQQYREALRDELGAGQIEAAQVDEELRHLAEALR